MGLLSFDNFRKVITNISDKGIGYTLSKVVSSIGTANAYDKWRQTNLPSKLELEQQRNTKFSVEPLISIVVPVYHTPQAFLVEMVESVLSQTYVNFELLLADANETQGGEEYKTALYEIAKRDKRIVLISLNENQGISENTNAALAKARGDYVAFLDHDDMLVPDALYEMVSVINEKNPDYIYSDEDKTDENTSRFFDPYFKSDYDIELLRSHNYICHFSMIRRTLFEELGGLRKEFDGAQDYDLILRVSEKTSKIEHIPKILYHWRVNANSTAGFAKHKSYTNDAGQSALEDHLKRCNIEGVVEHFSNKARYRVHYELKTKPGVCIYIHAQGGNNKRAQLLQQEMKDKTDYDNYEVVIGSESVETLKCDKDYVLYIEDRFHIRSKDWVQEMISYVQRKEVDVVCPKIMDCRGRVLGMEDIMNLSHIHDCPYDVKQCSKSGYFDKEICTLSLPRIRTDCYIMRKSCCVQDENLKIVYLPWVELVEDSL